eukprot:gene16440-19517_t
MFAVANNVLSAVAPRATPVQSRKTVVTRAEATSGKECLVNEFTTVGDVRRYREAELTHGRVAMLASVGFIVGENIEDFPLFGGVVSGPAITQFQQLPRGFWEVLVLVIGIAEAYRVAVGWATPTGAGFNQLKSEEEYNMGELDFDPLGYLQQQKAQSASPEEFAERVLALKNKELNNGRLAMIAIAGFVAQEFAEPEGAKEIFEHLFQTIEKDIVYEVEKVEEAVVALERAG